MTGDPTPARFGKVAAYALVGLVVLWAVGVLVFALIGVAYRVALEVWP